MRVLRRRVFAVGLSCPLSRPLIGLAGYGCNGVLPAVDASGPRRPLIRAFSSRAVRRQGLFRSSVLPAGVLVRLGVLWPCPYANGRGRACVINRDALPAMECVRRGYLACHHARLSGWRVLCATGCCPPWTLPSRAVRSSALFHPAPCVDRGLFRSNALPAGVLVRWGCFGRGRAPTGGSGLARQTEMPCPQWGFALRGAWQARFWRQRAGFSACA